MVRIEGRRKVRAHRLAYCQHHGVTLESIEGLSVRHKCDNPPCVNPNHLELGTHADNMRDKAERGRAPGIKGELNKAAKLTEEQVRDIRANCVIRAKGRSAQDYANKYGVTKALVCMVLKRKIWAHI